MQVFTLHIHTLTYIIHSKLIYFWIMIELLVAIILLKINIESVLPQWHPCFTIWRWYEQNGTAISKCFLFTILKMVFLLQPLWLTRFFLRWAWTRGYPTQEWAELTTTAGFTTNASIHITHPYINIYYTF